MTENRDHDTCLHWCGNPECFADCGDLVCLMAKCDSYPGDDRPYLELVEDK